ncbi:MAG: RNA-binding domain-containing protein [Candidatus Nitrosocosmicus sp.]|jgi:predicted RNA binding protein with dsRBD fold (UPF0201 family)|nr:hypothetical protein YTPLAS21_16890 [Candidatus Nitrosocosmicus sp.]
MNTITVSKKTTLLLPHHRFEMENNHVEITIMTPVNVTEDRQKVIFSLNNIFPKSELIEKKNTISIKEHDFKVLEKLKEKIKSKKSLAVLQRILYNNYHMENTWFLINKQAAFVDVVALIENENESPLGPIKISITGCNLEVVNEWFES